MLVHRTPTNAVRDFVYCSGMVRFRVPILRSCFCVDQDFPAGLERARASYWCFRDRDRPPPHSRFLPTKPLITFQGLAAYALGASLIQSGVRGRELSGFVLAFAVMTPAGILLGYLIEKDGEDDSAGAICVALAAGTFLYVSLMEVLPPELGSPKHGWAKMASLLAGFSVSAGVGWLVG